jgi:hypothetical protein
LFLIAGQVALAVFVNRVRPEARDPEFGTLLTALRSRLARAPGAPLVVVLGSSRTATSIRPAAVCAELGGGPEPVLFNMSIIAAGPLRELQTFRRLRAAGIRPDWLVLEVWPPYLLQEPRVAEEPYLLSHDIQWAEWLVLPLDPADYPVARRKLLEGLLVPGFAHRAGLLGRYAPALAEVRPAEGSWEDYRQRQAEAGWLPNPNRPSSAAEVACLRLWYLWQVAPILADFHVSPLKDRALRELLGECAGDGTRVALLLSPEHSGLRACYSEQTQARISTYLGQLAGEYGAAVVDSRAWMADEDFAEFTHLLPRAASPYTQRLGREALVPLLGDRLAAGAPRPEAPWVSNREARALRTGAPEPGAGTGTRHSAAMTSVVGVCRSRGWAGGCRRHGRQARHSRLRWRERRQPGPRRH